MITAQGYSKDPSIMPDAIVITFGADLIAKHKGIRKLLREFEWIMELHEKQHYWAHWIKNAPKHTESICYVYIIIFGRIYGRAYFGGIGQRLHTHIIVSGPLEKPKEKILLRGFQNFRYATKLF